MPTPHILIVAVDGLRASALGAYGNTMFPTPALDAFAAESLLLDWCYTPSADLAENYRALWHSVHPAKPLLGRELRAERQAASSDTPALPRLLAKHGYTTVLVTDEHELTSHALASEFDQCVQVANSSRNDSGPEHADDPSNTALARVFAAAGEVIAAPTTTPTMVWVHARGMYGPWDAPLDLQASLLDEGDPPPVESVAPPDFSIGETDDPDAVFRYGCAYAAQVMVLDTSWLDLLETAVSASTERQWLVMLIGARGFPLGEHQRIGGVDPRLYGEQLHVPWLVRFPDHSGRLARSGVLTSPLDMLPTLLEWVGADVPEAAATFDGNSVLPLINPARVPWRDALVCANAAGHRAIRTHEWCLRQNATAGERSELYVRPDDRWETNDVAKLCPEVIDRLNEEIDEFLRRK